LPLRRPAFGEWRSRVAGDQHPAGHDADVAGARDRLAGGALVRRVVELDGGGRFVSALKWRQDGRAGAVRPAFSGPSFSFGHFVLPRWLRRPARILGRLGEGEFAAPRYSATILSAALLGSSLLYGGYLGG